MNTDDTVGEEFIVDDIFVERWDGLIMSRLKAEKVEQKYLDDVKTMVWMRLIEHPSYDPKRGTFTTWLGWVVKSVVSNETKKRNRSKDALDQTDGMALEEASSHIGAEDAGTAADELARVFRTTTSISARDKQIVEDIHLGGMSYQMVATKYGMKVKNVDLILSRAMKALRDEAAA